jgi:hypothetical protein
LRQGEILQQQKKITLFSFFDDNDDDDSPFIACGGFGSIYGTRSLCIVPFGLLNTPGQERYSDWLYFIVLKKSAPTRRPSREEEKKRISLYVLLAIIYSPSTNCTASHCTVESGGEESRCILVSLTAEMEEALVVVLGQQQ